MKHKMTIKTLTITCHEICAWICVCMLETKVWWMKTCTVKNVNKFYKWKYNQIWCSLLSTNDSVFSSELSLTYSKIDEDGFCATCNKFNYIKIYGLCLS